MTVQTLLVVTLALGAGGLCKGATGVGLPLIALPILASFLGVPHAIAILTLPVVAANAWQVWVHRARWGSTHFLPALLASAVVGLVAGTVFMTVVPPAILKLTLGGMIVTYIVTRLLRPAFGLSAVTGQRFAPAVGLLAGAVQGSTGVSSPVLATFVHALRLDRNSYILAISTVFLLFGLLQLPALFVADLVTWGVLLESAFALLPVAALMPVGSYLARQLRREVFDCLLLLMLGLMTCNLLYGAIAQW